MTGDRGTPEPDVRYESYSHEQLKAEVDAGNDPESAGEIARGWAGLGQRLQDAVDALTAASSGSEEAWQGQGGEALRAAFARAGQWAQHAAETASEVGGGVAAQAGAAARARAAMPEPVAYDPAATIRDAVGGGDLAALVGLTDALAERREQAERARRQAIDVLYARDRALRDAVPAGSFTAPPSLSSRA
ncbi:PPE domain-containing protein [Prauserella rugosa]|uniref:PPE family protein n=1 Tax=Prauserella rugosa TaxID=43354 RepID=A0A660C657_9PSEU|nr:PPE domain-containing protein [Prauserella rugosa]KID28026.1 PPE family protein [Prauserella sp. Am3]KMS83317.1 PE-PGRS family protein [Streptomyces regensis]TWH18972.1 PPE family protein [Prauserella rugosa]